MAGQTRILELSQRAAVQSAPGKWTNLIPGGLTIEPGGALQVLSSYIDGSTASDIVVRNPINVTIYFSYWCRFIGAQPDSLQPAPAGIAGSPQLVNDVTQSGNQVRFGDILYVYDQTNQTVVVDQFTLNIPAGSYEPTILAEMITAQMRTMTINKANPAPFGFGSCNAGTSPNGINLQPVTANLYRDGSNSPTYRGTYEIDPDDTPPPVADRSIIWKYSDPANTATATEAFPADTYQHGTSAPTLTYLEDEQRFQWNFHDSITNPTGVPCCVRVARNEVTGYNTFAFGGKQGISIRDWGVLEADWPNSIYALLGFTYQDLQAPASQSLGIVTQDIAPPSIYSLLGDGSANAGGNSAYFAVGGKQDTGIILQAINPESGGQSTTGPISSLPAGLSNTNSAYWRISIRGCSTTGWISSAGRLNSVFSVADQSYPSGALYVGGSGSVFAIEDTEPRTISNLEVIISNSVDADDSLPDSTLGLNCSVILAYYAPTVSSLTNEAEAGEPTQKTETPPKSRLRRFIERVRHR